MLLKLFITFAKIGGFTFGGGYAMLPMLEREVVKANGWATEDELMDYYAIGQCTPGIIAVNTSTFIGYKVAGIAGALAATAGCVTPSFVIICVITAFLESFNENLIIAHALSGIRLCVCALVLDAVIKLGKKSLKDAFSVLLFAVGLALAMFSQLPAALLVVAAGCLGLAFSMLKKKKEGLG